MKRPLLLFISCLALLSAKSQVLEKIDGADTVVTDSVVTDTVKTAAVEEPEVPKEKPVFFQSAISIDYGKLGSTAIGLDEKYEGGISLLFIDLIYLSAEYGLGVLEPENAFKNGTYRSDGSYFRSGAGVLKALNAKNRLGFGVMYAQAAFEDEARVSTTSPTGVQGDYEKTVTGKDMTAQWIELVLTSESRLALNKDNPESKFNKFLALGFNFRLRFMNTYPQREPIDVYAIPGYGRTVNNPNAALNLFLKIYLF